MPILPTVGKKKLRQKDSEFEAKVSNIAMVRGWAQRQREGGGRGRGKGH